MKSTEMSRDFTPGEFEELRTDGTVLRERTPEPDTKHPEQGRSPGRNPRIDRDAETPRDPRPDSARSSDSRTLFYERDRAYRLRESEVHTLTELGKFRVISTEDLASHAYQGHREEMEHDIRNLSRQGLIQQGAFEGPEANRREMLTLTKEGHGLLRANRFVSDGQSTYHGFVKPKEANHDADIYRLYQKEASRILDEGGKNLRVVLDFEMKKKLNRDFVTFGAESRQEIASRHGLQVVGEKIPVPDLRIEYETRDGEMARVDLELVTEHYRPSYLAEKVRAGFSLYAPRSEADRLRRVLDQRELTAEILSL
jgi:hypothetical protein